MFCPALKPVLTPVARGVQQACSGVVGDVVPLLQELFTDAENDTGFSYTRATTQYVETDTGALYPVPAGAIPIKGARPVRNLAASSDTPSTQNITVVVGHVYAVRIGSESASGATAVCSGAFTGTLTGDATDIQAFPTGKTATTTTLTVTITGSIRKLMVQDITHRSALSTAPDEYVSTGVGTGANVVSGDAASDDTNSVGNWDDAAGSSILTSQNTVTNGSSYAIEIDANTTPTSSARGFIDLNGLCETGKIYEIVFDIRHAGVGGQWIMGLGATNSATTDQIGALINSSATIFAERRHTFTYAIGTNRYLVFKESSATNDGGVFIDNLSIRECDPGLTGIDGFTYFTTALANTVDGSGVVTEGTGAALTGIALANVPGATNLFTYSSDLSNAYWSKVNASAPNENILREANDVNQVHYFSKGLTVTAGVRYVAWVLVSGNDRDFIRLDFASSGFPVDCECYFDTVNGVVGETVGSDLDDYGIFEYGNGFVCFISATAVSNNAGVIYCSMAIADGDQDYDGDGISELTIEHIQLEINAFTAPIVTSGSTASTDSAVLDFSGVTGFTVPNETRIVATGLGPNLVTNGDFSDGANGWDAQSGAVLSNDSGALKVTTIAPDTVSFASQVFTVEANTPYLFIVNVVDLDNLGRLEVGDNDPNVFENDYVNNTSLSVAVYSYSFVTNSSTEMNIGLYSSALGVTDQSAWFDNVHVHKIDPTDTTERIIDVDNWDGTDLSDILPHANIKSVTVYAPGDRP